ncbi:hypothetical protein K466DRAFT_593169 [Polyporus arcularius HHB13444]|uniref:Uncharacterized protein n=1 Tax=Polyporus arcularius HHB13444 TaxID=1314778 RepID=A0A5C3PZD2_9APHY|nr:hypothetical protein K466DRAFT_593169 [Polyporus arcularius HHB13444]
MPTSAQLTSSTTKHSHRLSEPLHKVITMGAIIVVNSSSSPVQVFVSKYSNSNGSDEWFTIAPGKRDSWARNGWELVAFKTGNDTNRAGKYVPVDTEVVFTDLAHITVN